MSERLTVAGVGAAVSTEEDGDQLCDLVQGERLGKRRGAQGRAQGGGREGSGEGRQDEEGNVYESNWCFYCVSRHRCFFPC